MYLTIDIGGTKTFIALFDARGRILKSDKFPTDHDLDTFLNTFFEHLKPFSNTSPVNIAIAVAGVVKNNRPVWFGNLPWQNPPLEKPLKNLFTCPIYFLNDADSAAFYEANFYSGKTIYLTFSTGIGGGIASRDNKVVRLDPASSDFEPGHKKYDFEGKNLEWEDFAAASSIRKAYGDRKVTSLKEKSAFLDIALRVALGLVDIINEYRPDTIVFGGPLALIFRKWRLPLKIVLKNILNDKKLPKLRRAKKPDLCVSYGAYYYGVQKASEEPSRV